MFFKIGSVVVFLFCGQMAALIHSFEVSSGQKIFVPSPSGD